MTLRQLPKSLIPVATSAGTIAMLYIASPMIKSVSGISIKLPIVQSETANVTCEVKINGVSPPQPSEPEPEPEPKPGT